MHTKPPRAPARHFPAGFTCDVHKGFSPSSLCPKPVMSREFDLMVPADPFQPGLSYNMPTYALWCVFLTAFHTNEREKLRHLPKKRRNSHSSEVRAFTLPARGTLVDHWRNVLRSCDFKQLVNDKIPNKDSSGGLFLCLINIILNKWENKETIVGREKDNNE